MGTYQELAEKGHISRNYEVPNPQNTMKRANLVLEQDGRETRIALRPSTYNGLNIFANYEKLEWHRTYTFQDEHRKGLNSSKMDMHYGMDIKSPSYGIGDHIPEDQWVLKMELWFNAFYSEKQAEEGRDALAETLEGVSVEQYHDPRSAYKWTGNCYTRRRLIESRLHKDLQNLALGDRM